MVPCGDLGEDLNQAPSLTLISSKNSLIAFMLLEYYHIFRTLPSTQILIIGSSQQLLY